MEATTRPNIFNYKDPRLYLLDSLAWSQKLNPRYSLRSWAKSMGLKGHTLLTMIMKGQRPLRVKHSLFLAKGLKLNADERLYLQALIQFHNAKGPEEKHLHSLWLRELNPGQEFKVIEFEHYEMISHWVHSAILAMADIPKLNGNIPAIKKSLGNKASLSEIRAAIERLKSLGLIQEDRHGRWKTDFSRVSSKNDQPSLGVRNHHSKVGELALQALHDTPVEQREFQASSMAIPVDKIPLAKEMIRRFRSQLEQAIESSTADEVYQFNIQFFPLTQSSATKSADKENLENSNRSSK